MSGNEELLARTCIRVIEAAAKDLGIAPLELARSLQDGQVARLVHLLNAAHRHVDHPALRHRIEDLLSSVTGGRMPMADAETELDWALKVARRRREDAHRAGPIEDDL